MPTPRAYHGVMKMRFDAIARWGTCFLLAMATAIVAGEAPATSRPATVPVKPDDKLSVTEHELRIGQQAIRYRATAGHMVVRDEAGKDKAEFFHVAYERITDDADPSKRPLTFVFNGGPGAAAVWLHLGTAGPRSIRWASDKGEAVGPPYQLIDNPQTWLDVTDLVFIDPVNTGYSRAAQGEKPEQFFGVEADVRSVADFIRLYTTRNRRWLSPKFLAGESYGTTRAAALSEFLLDRYGIALNGIMLISVVLDFQTLHAGNGNDLPYALFLPTYTATAMYHQKLDAELQKTPDRTLREVEEFALGEYLLALTRGGDLSREQRKLLAARLARYTGLAADLFDKADLRIGPGVFRKELLADQRRVLGRFDTRITGYDARPVASEPAFDPSFSPYFAAYSAAMNDYARRILRFESDLPYEVLSDRVQPWSFGREGMGYLNVADELRSAMIKNPKLRVLFANGYYDLATPYLASDYTVKHLDLGGRLRANVTQAYYGGGHMMYHDRAAMAKLKADIRDFMQAAVE